MSTAVSALLVGAKSGEREGEEGDRDSGTHSDRRKQEV